MADEREKTDAEAPVAGVDPTAGDAQSTPLDQTTDLAKLREQLQAKEKEATENYDRYLRQVAELENFRKRASREKQEAIRFANEALVKDLLPVVRSEEHTSELQSLR